MDRTQELEEQVRRLTQTVEAMRGRMTRLEGRESPSENGSKGSDRRGFLRLGAGAVLGALGWAAATAAPVSATDGGSIIIGNDTQLAETPTTLKGDGAAGAPTPVFAAIDQTTTWVEGVTGTFAGPLQGQGGAGGISTAPDGVDGWASGIFSAGVYGLSDSGYGVIGESNTGIGLYARTSGRIGQTGLLGAGNPGYVPGPGYETVRDANGVLWIHNLAGAWRRVNTVRVDTADGLGTAYKPFRRLDTRSGSRKSANSITHVSIAGTGSGASAIPVDAIAAVGNLTATDYTGPGFLTISPNGISVATSTVNFQIGQIAIANSFICGLNGGSLQVFVGGHASHFIIDITAYIQ
jgi:hypothetical protein